MATGTLSVCRKSLLEFHYLTELVLEMDGPIDDEKKPFDVENPEEEDSQPDPDEHLMLDQGNGRVWLVKVCPFDS